MKGLLFFGRPRRRRLAMTFGYECRPSLWRTLRSNSHLVIAAFGTASFLAVAAIALWLALPSVDRPAFAEAGHQPVVQAAGPSVAAEPVIAAKPPPVQASAVADEADEAPNDLRWKDPNAAKRSAQAADAAAKASRKAVNAESGSAVPAAASNPQLAAFAAANRAEVNGDGDTGADVAQTAAVPTPRPAKPEKLVAKAQPDEAQPASADGNETAPGHILRGVTMRSGPKKGASAIDTIPAKTAVRIVNCNQWCEILYDGKRGWIYKTFVARD